SDPLRGVAPAREPADALAELPLLDPFGPFERTTIVVARIASELARQLTMGGHPGGVQTVVGVRLLPDRVQPGERRAARAAAGNSGVDRQHPRARPRGRVDGRRAHDPQTDDGNVVLFHGDLLRWPHHARQAHYRVPRDPATRKERPPWQPSSSVVRRRDSPRTSQPDRIAWRPTSLPPREAPRPAPTPTSSCSRHSAPERP